MSRLTFLFPMQSAELANLDVPLEIRDENMSLVANTLASQSVQVEPGTYIVTATLPAGQRVSKVVQAHGFHQEISLDVPSAQASPHEWREVDHYFASARAQRSVRTMKAGSSLSNIVIRDIGGLESFTPKPILPAACLRMFGGNLLKDALHAMAVDAVRTRFEGDIVHLRCGPAQELRIVQMVQTGRAPVNIALPVSRYGCTIVVRRELERYWTEVHPEDEQSNLLLGYTQNRMLQQQETVAEGLLNRKREDPIAAAVGAYALLRTGELDRLHHWTDNLAHWFEWLPDGAAIRGEHLARLGRHDEALVSFLKVFQRGLPLFSDGVRFTHDRLRNYRALEVGHPDIAPLLTALRAFVSFVDFDKAVTTFTGIDPANPDDDPAVTLPVGDRLDLAPLFSQ